jgi:hypothetical protein
MATVSYGCRAASTRESAAPTFIVHEPNEIIDVLSAKSRDCSLKRYRSICRTKREHTH